MKLLVKDAMLNISDDRRRILEAQFGELQKSLEKLSPPMTVADWWLKTSSDNSTKGALRASRLDNLADDIGLAFIANKISQQKSSGCLLSDPHRAH